MNGGVALGTVVVVGTDGVVNPFGGLVDAAKLFELGFGGFVKTEVF